MNRSSLLISIFLVAIAAAACSASSKKLDLGGTCIQNSDCNNPLSCKFATCHQQCVQSRDCPTGERCVIVDGSGVCQTPAESVCGAKCVAPWVCNTVDSTCRSACTSNAGCLSSQTCTGTFCVDNTELTGGACTLNSDCANPLVCQMGSCRQECTSSASCASGGHCVIVDGVPVCLTPVESAACGVVGGACASPLVCNPVDNTCRAACTSGCLSSQTCVGTVCMDTTELAGHPGYDGSAGAGGGTDAGSVADGAAGGSGDASPGIDAPAPGIDSRADVTVDSPPAAAACTGNTTDSKSCQSGGKSAT
jgi:hypothetical protein